MPHFAAIASSAAARYGSCIFADVPFIVGCTDLTTTTMPHGLREPNPL
jgi:hypothetical protein